MEERVTKLERYVKELMLTVKDMQEELDAIAEILEEFEEFVND